MRPQRARIEWVATPPPGTRLPEEPPRLTRYLGPPSYRTPPRWGFPPLAWRWPTSLPGATTTTVAPADRLRMLDRYARFGLGATAAVAFVAAVAEGWRYVLLLQSRNGALSRGTVQVSDSVVVTAAVLAIGLAALAVVLTVWWLVVARQAAAELSGHDPARPDWHLLPALLIPGVNLVVPGSVLAELEHAALRRPPDERPTPTRLLAWWWAAWVSAGLLFTATVLWRFRDGVQAQADGVLLSLAGDLAAAVVAVLTTLLVTKLSTLLTPTDPTGLRLHRVVSVTGAPEPPLRATRASRSPR